MFEEVKFWWIDPLAAAVIPSLLVFFLKKLTYYYLWLLPTADMPYVRSSVESRIWYISITLLS